MLKQTEGFQFAHEKAVQDLAVQKTINDAEAKDYVIRVAALELSGMDARLKAVGWEELSEENAQLRTKCANLYEENLELNRTLATAAWSARRDVARIEVALESAAGHKMRDMHNRLREELWGEMDEATRKLVSEHGSLQEQVVRMGMQTRALDSKVHNLSAAEQKLRMDADLASELGDLQSKQAVKFKVELREAQKRATLLSRRLAEAEVEAAHYRALLTKQPGLLQSPRFKDLSGPMGQDASGGAAATESNRLADQLVRCQRRMQQLHVQRDTWRSRADVYSRACTALQAMLLVMQQQRAPVQPRSSRGGESARSTSPTFDAATGNLIAGPWGTGDRYDSPSSASCPSSARRPRTSGPAGANTGTGMGAGAGVGSANPLAPLWMVWQQRFYKGPGSKWQQTNVARLRKVKEKEMSAAGDPTANSHAATGMSPRPMSSGGRRMPCCTDSPTSRPATSKQRPPMPVPGNHSGGRGGSAYVGGAGAPRVLFEDVVAKAAASTAVDMTMKHGSFQPRCRSASTSAAASGRQSLRLNFDSPLSLNSLVNIWSSAGPARSTVLGAEAIAAANAAIRAASPGPQGTPRNSSYGTSASGAPLPPDGSSSHDTAEGGLKLGGSLIAERARHFSAAGGWSPLSSATSSNAFPNFASTHNLQTANALHTNPVTPVHRDAATNTLIVASGRHLPLPLHYAPSSTVPDPNHHGYLLGPSGSVYPDPASPSAVIKYGPATPGLTPGSASSTLPASHEAARGSPLMIMGSPSLSSMPLPLPASTPSNLSVISKDGHEELEDQPKFLLPSHHPEYVSLGGHGGAAAHRNLQRDLSTPSLLGAHTPRPLSPVSALVMMSSLPFWSEKQQRQLHQMIKESSETLPTNAGCRDGSRRKAITSGSRDQGQRGVMASQSSSKLSVSGSRSSEGWSALDPGLHTEMTQGGTSNGNEASSPLTASARMMHPAPLNSPGIFGAGVVSVAAVAGNDGVPGEGVDGASNQDGYVDGVFYSSEGVDRYAGYGSSMYDGTDVFSEEEEVGADDYYQNGYYDDVADYYEDMVDAVEQMGINEAAAALLAAAPGQPVFGLNPDLDPPPRESKRSMQPQSHMHTASASSLNGTRNERGEGHTEASETLTGSDTDPAARNARAGGDANTSQGADAVEGGDSDIYTDTDSAYDPIIDSVSMSKKSLNQVVGRVQHLSPTQVMQQQRQLRQQKRQLAEGQPPPPISIGSSPHVEERPGLPLRSRPAMVTKLRVSRLFGTDPSYGNNDGNGDARLAAEMSEESMRHFTRRAESARPLATSSSSTRASGEFTAFRTDSATKASSPTTTVGRSLSDQHRPQTASSPASPMTPRTAAAATAAHLTGGASPPGALYQMRQRASGSVGFGPPLIPAVSPRTHGESPTGRIFHNITLTQQHAGVHEEDDQVLMQARSGDANIQRFSAASAVAKSLSAVHSAGNFTLESTGSRGSRNAAAGAASAAAAGSGVRDDSHGQLLQQTESGAGAARLLRLDGDGAGLPVGAPEVTPGTYPFDSATSLFLKSMTSMGTMPPASAAGGAGSGAAMPEPSDLSTDLAPPLTVPSYLHAGERGDSVLLQSSMSRMTGVGVGASMLYSPGRGGGETPALQPSGVPSATEFLSPSLLAPPSLSSSSTEQPSALQNGSGAEGAADGQAPSTRSSSGLSLSQRLGILTKNKLNPNLGTSMGFPSNRPISSVGVGRSGGGLRGGSGGFQIPGAGAAVQGPTGVILGPAAGQSAPGPGGSLSSFSGLRNPSLQAASMARSSGSSVSARFKSPSLSRS